MLTFSSPGGTFWCSLQAWQRLAKLAAEQGWTPTGIPRPAAESDSEEWAAYLPEKALEQGESGEGGDSWLAKGVMMPEEDMTALAGALEAALPDIPRFDALSEKTAFQLDMPAFIPLKVLRPGAQVSNYEFFSGANRQALERFIEVVRSGPVKVS